MQQAYALQVKTEHLCPSCREKKPLDQFQRGAGWCRACRTILEAQRRRAKGVPEQKQTVIVGNDKSCLECGEMKPLEDFSPTPRGRGGRSAYCRPCATSKFKPEPELVRQRTADYRGRHRERHLANHRKHQFERRSQQKVTDDGTVTDVFLKALYATERCLYCEQVTPEDQRTAEHKTPLSRGGSHSAENMGMACFSCNSAKGAMTEDEFRRKIA